ncbi:MAG: ABC transporter permease [Pseudomonadota bacterium]
MNLKTSKILTVIKESFNPFFMNPLRSFLALLGILFGVSAVVAMMSIGEGAQKQIMEMIESMGADIVTIDAVKGSETDVANTINLSRGLRRSDVQSIVGMSPGIQKTDVAYIKRFEIYNDNLDSYAKKTEVFGISKNYVKVKGLTIRYGRDFSYIDFESMHNVCIVGYPFAKKLFPKDPEKMLGFNILLNSVYFRVIGLLDEIKNIKYDKDENLEKYNPDQYNDTILVPIDVAFEKLIPPYFYMELDNILVKVGSIANTIPYKKIFQKALKRTHGGIEDFKIIAPEELLKQKEETQRIFNIVLLCIAAISLIVGGIGIMNIMLANILERIKEIGIRRAVGASKKDILIQFLSESVTICLLGGVLGILFGLLIAVIVSFYTDIYIAFSYSAMIVAFLIAVSTGVIFGILPAIRAANINPIEALHRE